MKYQLSSNHCAQREGDSRVLSQETGPVKHTQNTSEGEFMKRFLTALLLLC